MTLQFSCVVPNSGATQPGLRARTSYIAIDELVGTSDWESIAEKLRLSPRELEIVRLVINGRKLTAIATELHLGLGTVKTYSQRAYRKLHVSDQRELTVAILHALMVVRSPAELSAAAS
jgi:DNA-binding NarL/FixJ family response regulator